MSIYSREQALSILGIDNGSDEKKIREAYHELLKEYHPDNQPDDKTIYKYYSIVEAYDFLMKWQENISQPTGTGPRILGDSDALKQNSLRKKSREERERYERINGNGREKRLHDMIEESKKLREQEEAEK